MRFSIFKQSARFTLPVIAPVFLYLLLSSGTVVDGQSHRLIRIGSMHETRASHTATVLQDGKVLIAGGFRKGPDGQTQVYSRSAELFDPKSRSFIATGDMNARRCGHTATLLPGGKVLIAGGFTDNGLTASAELYDPSSRTFETIGEMSAARGDFTATLLQTGDVLLAGGGDHDPTATAELFHPQTTTFSTTGSMAVPRFGHTATALPNGKVLVAGGMGIRAVLASTERYDPRTGTFTVSGSMNQPRYKHAAVLLRDGHTLILGGSDSRDWRGKYRSAEIYDWRAARFTPIADMASQRFKFPAAVAELSTGNILVCGGSNTIELFDFYSKCFQPTSQFDQSYYYGTASFLGDRSTLIVGGYTDSLQSTDKAWLYIE